MKVFQIDDGEMHLVAAQDEDSARRVYLELVGEENAENMTVKEIRRERWSSVKVKDEDDGRIWTIEEMVTEDSTKDAFMIGSTLT